MKFRFKPTASVDRHELGKYPSQSETPIAVNEHYALPKDQEQVCQWGIGWKTTFILSGSYLLALALAITHAVVFRYLNGKFEDDPNIPSQTHLTAASTIMANVVGFLIRICLAAAFTQYFWHLVRVTPMRLETLEFLYTMRGSPTSFFSLTAIQKGWMLGIITIILWVIPIAMSFPSSAMTIRNALYTHVVPHIDVPVLNAQEIWDKNTTKILLDELVYLVVTNEAESNDPDYVRVVGGPPTTYQLTEMEIRPVIRQLATDTLVNGVPRTTNSPCGVNCTYEISFDGPYLNCNQTTTQDSVPTFHHNTSYRLLEIYSANWTTDSGFLRDYRLKNIDVDHIAKNHTSNHTTLEYNTTVVTCRPSRAKYHVVQDFRNGQQSSTVTTQDPQDLVSLDDYIHFTEYNITSDIVDQIRDRNLMALIIAMTGVLTGSVEAIAVGTQTRFEPLAQPAAFIPSGVMGNILAMNTPMYSEYSDTWVTGADSLYYSMFTVDEDILNSMLANVTLSVINQFQLNSASTNVTRHDQRTQFVFSRPINLLLPYFLSLGLALPLAGMGYWSLRQNGVPATDNGFLQVAMTTRGNRELDHLAMGGCLGGNHNESAQLKQLEVQFGELSRPETRAGSPDIDFKPEIRMAGFGPKDEVTPLLVGEKYGNVNHTE
ncbi:hypothetical protein BDV25DRAFT_169157 [Aspergillus avenaceus]|uniref:Uncharacterized protein n=1 Tax=Aspergillus avenaceus TaxID=36643 RepID=A0A5N6U3S0_ASPAV|nr:hypothetical protein BDV25DRAFT_169157 [Aspergillus avenaceus]